MSENRLSDVVGRQQWLGWLGDRLAPAVGKVFAAAGDRGSDVKDFLNGVWLGHALHPAITDIPVGAWTAALVMDAADGVSRNEGLRQGASLAIGVGLVGAVGAAVTGLTDWSDTDGKARRIGLAHGLLNLAAASLYAGSLVARANKHHAKGKALGVAGYGMAFFSAYLGGELVYTEQVNVNRSVGQEGPEQFTAVLAEQELRDSVPVRAQFGNTPVVLVREAGHVYALADTCSHLGGPLSEGSVEDGTIACPWHGSRYRLGDGSIVNGPTTHAQPWFECRVRAGQVEIRRRQEPAAPTTQPEVPAKERRFAS